MSKRFPRVDLPIEQLDYCWAPAEGSNTVAPKVVDAYNRIQQCLEQGIGLDAVKVGKYDQVGKRVRSDLPRVQSIYNHIAEARQKGEGINGTGLINPLIVFPIRREYHHVIVGNQRLCALRALHHDGLVPCVINDSRSAKEVFQHHPYEEVRMRKR